MANMDKSLLDFFWKLGEEKEATRLEAAYKVLLRLRTAGKPNKGNSSHGDQDAEIGSKDMFAYIFRRLIRGLASDKASSRTGYFVCLVELLRQKHDEISVQQAFGVMENVLNVQGKGSKSEEGSSICGKILCYGALIRSGTVNSQSEEMSFVVQQLLGLSKKRSYAMVLAIQFIVQLVRNESDEQAFKRNFWPLLKDGFKWRGSEATLESIWLLVEIHDKFSSALDKSFLAEIFGSKRLLDQTFAAEVANIFLSGNVFLQTLRNGPMLKRIVAGLDGKKGLLLSFWTKHIDPAISKASCYKTSVAFTVLDAIFDSLSDKSEVPKFLTENLLVSALFLVSRSDCKPGDNALVLCVLKKLVNICKDAPTIHLPVLKVILTSPGNIAFDKVTGSGVVQKILSAADASTVKYVSRLYRDAVVGVTADDNKKHIFTTQERVYAIHQLTKLVSHPSIQNEIEWKEELLNFLLATTLFELKKPHGSIKSAPLAFSREAKTQVRDSFFKALDIKVKSFETVCDVLLKVVDFACGLLADPTVASLKNPLSKNCQSEWKKMVKEVNEIRKKNSVSKEDRVFQLLFIHLGFQLLAGEEEAVEILRDLHSCYDQSKRAESRKKMNSKLRKKTVDCEAELVWVEVVVDLLLSLLSQNKSVLRQVVNSVTALLCPHMTANALQTVIDVIDDEEKNEDDEEDNEDGEDDDDDEDMENGEADSESEESADEEEENISDDEELRTRIKMAMGEKLALDSDAESIDMDDLDEEEMKRMDEALGKAFKMLSKKRSRSEEKKRQRDLIVRMHFKARALDILDVYLNHHPPMSHVLYLIMPLINAIHTTSKVKELQPLHIRLKSTLKKLTATSTKKADADRELDARSVAALLQSLVDISNSGTPLMAQLTQPHPLFAQTCTLVFKCSQQLNDPELDAKVFEIYSLAMDDFFNKGHCQLPLGFFLRSMQGNWTAGWKLASKLIENGFSSTTRQFRRTQALTLLTTLVKSPSCHDASSDPTVKTAIERLSQHILSDFEEYAKGVEMKPRYICELLHLVHALHSVGGHDDDDPKWEALRQALTQVRDRIPQNRHFQDVKKAYNKACVPLKIQVVQASHKRKSVAKEPVAFGDLANDDDDDDEKPAKVVKQDDHSATVEVEKTGKKKKHLSKDGAQRRKERKLFEIDGQFKGLEMPSFNGLHLDNNLNFTNAQSEAAAAGGKAKKKDSDKAKTKSNGDVKPKKKLKAP